MKIVEATAWHHKPSRSTDLSFSVLAAVHAGNVLAHENAEAHTSIASPSGFDVFYLAELGLVKSRNIWREVRGLPVKEDQETLQDQARCRLEANHN